MTKVQIIDGRERVNYAVNPSFELFGAAAGDNLPVGWDYPATNMMSRVGITTLGSPVFAGRTGVAVLGQNPAAPGTTPYASLTLFDLPANTLMYVTVEVYLTSATDSVELTATNFSTSDVETVNGTGSNMQVKLEVEVTTSNTGLLLVDLKASPVTVGTDAGAYFDSLYISDTPGAYFDGDTPGARWLGTPHASRSVMPAETLYSGTLNDLKEMGLLFHTIQGFGNTDLELITNEDANGLVRVDRPLSRPRNLTLVLTTATATREEFYKKRAKLLEILYPRGESQGRIFRFINDEEISLDLPVWYRSGLAGANIGGSNIERMALQLFAPDPYPYATLPDNQILDLEDTVSFNYVLKTTVDSHGFSGPGNVTTLLTGLPSAPAHMVIMPDGVTLVAVNDNLGGGATPQGRVYADNGPANSWRLIATTNNYINKLAVYGIGKLLVGGLFTTVTPAGGAGTTANRIFMATFYSYSTTISGVVNFNANGTVNDIFVAPGYGIYVAGAFTTINGTSANKMALLIPNAAATSATTRLIDPNNPLPSADVSAIMSINNDVYIGGAFLAMPDENANYFARYDVGADKWRNLGTVPGPVNKILKASNGTYYLYSNTGTTFFYQGTSSKVEDVLTTVGNVILDAVYMPATDSILVVGLISWLDYKGVRTYGKQIYEYANGSIKPYPVRNTANNPAIIATQGDKVHIGYNGTAPHTVRIGGYVAIEVNGNMPANPYLVISGQGVLTSIENVTTGRGIYLNYAIAPGEIVTIDTRASSLGMRSSQAGDISYALDPNSSLESFTLEPGYNYIRAFIDRNPNGLTPTTVAPNGMIYYHARYISLDAASGGENEA